jgi:hypothetical protein
MLCWGSVVIIMSFNAIHFHFILSFCSRSNGNGNYNYVAHCPVQKYPIQAQTINTKIMQSNL